MKKLTLLLFLCCLPLWAVAAPTGNCSSWATPQCSDSQTITTSGAGGKITIGSNGGQSLSLEYLIGGDPQPDSLSIVVQGCAPGGTCETLDTYTTVANTIRGIATKKPYAYYTVTATWSGGTSVSVQVNTKITTARAGGSGLPDAGSDGACLVSNSGDWARGACSGTPSSGTVTHTGGALTATAVLAGNGGDDAKASSCTVSDAGQMTCSSLTGSTLVQAPLGQFGRLEMTGASTDAPLNIDNSAAPTTNLAAGDLYENAGLFYGYTGAAFKQFSFSDHAHTGMAVTVASGTATLATASIAANSCASAVTVSATGVATTDVISWTPNADISGVTGYTPGGTLRIYPYPTADNINFKVCNGSSTDAVVPGSAVVLNWRVTR